MGAAAAIIFSGKKTHNGFPIRSLPTTTSSPCCTLLCLCNHWIFVTLRCWLWRKIAWRGGKIQHLSVSFAKFKVNVCSVFRTRNQRPVSCEPSNPLVTVCVYVMCYVCVCMCILDCMCMCICVSLSLQMCVRVCVRKCPRDHFSFFARIMMFLSLPSVLARKRMNYCGEKKAQPLQNGKRNSTIDNGEQPPDFCSNLEGMKL